MGWETHGSLQARRSHIRRAGAAHDERRSREHEHHGRQMAPTERGGNRTPSSRGEGAWVGRRHGSLQARRSHIPRADSKRRTECRRIPRADSKRPRSKDVCWLVVVPAMARRNIEWCGRVESHGRERLRSARFDYRYVPRDVTDRERSIVSVDVRTDLGKHVQNTVYLKRDPCTPSFRVTHDPTTPHECAPSIAQRTERTSSHPKRSLRGPAAFRSASRPDPPNRSTPCRPVNGPTSLLTPFGFHLASVLLERPLLT